MEKAVTVIKSSILAGICIGIAGFGFLALGGIAGAVLFAFGLITVVCYKLKLYTGTAGFIVKGEVGTLLLILIGNIVGCLLVAGNQGHQCGEAAYEDVLFHSIVFSYLR